MDYHEQLKDSKIEVLVEAVRVKAYYLRKYPNKRTMSTLLIFTPEGIVITGDLRPVRTGCMTYGYGLEWFVGANSPQYLAEKFLEMKWTEDHARDFVQNRIAEMNENEEYELASRVRDIVEDGGNFENEWVFYNAFSDVLDTSDMGLDYIEHEVGWLSAIQKRFAEEWHKLKGKQKE